MLKKVMVAGLILLVMLTALGCVPEEKPADSEEIKETQLVTVPQTSVAETTETTPEEERDISEQKQQVAEPVSATTEPDTTLEDAESTDADKTEAETTQSQGTEVQTPDREHPRDEDETERT